MRMKRALAALVLLLAVGSAYAQDEGDDTALVQRLVLNSASLRQSFEERAADEQRALFQQLSAREEELAFALRDANLQRAERERLEAETARNAAERQGLIDQLTRQSSAFANERRALVQQFIGVVAEASPEKRALLERFAAGDRTVAYDQIEELTLAENAAFSAAANAASAQNLRNLLTLAQEMMLRGEKSAEDLLPLARAILENDPTDVDVARQLIASLTIQFRDAEIVAFADGMTPMLRDDWDLLQIEAAALNSRLILSPIAQATARLDAVIARVADAHPNDEGLTPEQLLTFCDAVEDRAFNTTALRQMPRLEGIVRDCVDAYGRSLELRFSAFTLLKLLGDYHSEERRYDEVRRIAEVYRRHFERFEFSVPWIESWLAYQLASMERAAELGNGRREAGNAISLGAVETVISIAPNMFVEQRDFADEQLAYIRVGMLASDGKEDESYALLRTVVTRQYGQLPTSMDREIEVWILRQATQTSYAQLAMRRGELDEARQALDRANAISVALQRLHPLAEPSLVRATHVSVYSNLTVSALIRAELRDLEGQHEEASTRLAAVLAALEPHLRSPIYSPVFPPFRVGALLTLGEIAARHGNIETARTRLTEARVAIAEYATLEPNAFGWVETDFHARLRLAQLAEDMEAIRTLRDERDALNDQGKSFDPDQPWVMDLQTWRRGRPIRWHYSEPRDRR